MTASTVEVKESGCPRPSVMCPIDAVFDHPSLSDVPDRAAANTTSNARLAPFATTALGGWSESGGRRVVIVAVAFARSRLPLGVLATTSTEIVSTLGPMSAAYATVSAGVVAVSTKVPWPPPFSVPPVTVVLRWNSYPGRRSSSFRDDVRDFGELIVRAQRDSGKMLERDVSAVRFECDLKRKRQRAATIELEESQYGGVLAIVALKCAEAPVVITLRHNDVQVEAEGSDSGAGFDLAINRDRDNLTRRSKNKAITVRRQAKRAAHLGSD